MELQAPVSLPYFADGFPREVLDEIDQGEPLGFKHGEDPDMEELYLKGFPRPKNPPPRWPKVLRVREIYAVKIRPVAEWHGEPEFITEVDNLHFLERHAPGVAPRLYAAYIKPSKFGDLLHIISECIPGMPLDRVFASLQESDKTEIFTNIRESLEIVRKLQPPPNHVGWVTGKPFVGGGLLPKGPVGPWTSAKEMMDMIIQRQPEMMSRQTHSYMDVTLAYELFMSMAPRHFSNHLIKFSHMDLSWENVIVEKSSDGQWHVKLIDWETSGWFPEFFDYAYATYYALKLDSMVWIDRMFDQQYDIEALLMKLLRTVNIMVKIR